MEVLAIINHSMNRRYFMKQNIINNLSLNSSKIIFSLVTFLLTSYHNTATANEQTAINKANSAYCTPNANKAQVDFTQATLRRESAIPLMYQGFNNLEGPLWYKGALYYTNMGSHQPTENGFSLSNQATIWRWVPGSKPEVWLTDNHAGTNGLAINSKGHLLAARQLDGSISYIDWHSKKIRPLVSKYEDKRFNSPNDLTIAYDDTIYFTDPTWNIPSNINLADVQGGGEPGSTSPGQRIYRVTSDGIVSPTAVTELVPALRDKPNGIILSLDQQQLIVGGLAGLWRFDLNAGHVSNPKKLLTTPVDGLGKDCQGNIYVTTSRVLPERKDGQVIVVLNKHYQEIGMLTVPGIHIVTNVAFGGADRQTLFVTALTAPMDGEKIRQCGKSDCLAAGIYSAKMNVQGFPF